MSRVFLPILVFYGFIGILAIAIGLGYIYAYDGPTHFTELFIGAPNGQYHDMIEIPIPNTPYLFPILPISAMILGSFLIFFTKKWGWRALPLTLMGAGWYDISSQYQPPSWPYRIMQGQIWAELQLLELVLGFLLAGAPRFKTTVFLPLVILSFVTLSSTPYYTAYVFCLFLFLYTSISGFRWPMRKTSLEDTNMEILR